MRDITCNFCGKHFTRAWGTFCSSRCRGDGANLNHLLKRKAGFEKAPGLKAEIEDLRRQLTVK